MRKLHELKGPSLGSGGDVRECHTALKQGYVGHQHPTPREACGSIATLKRLPEQRHLVKEAEMIDCVSSTFCGIVCAFLPSRNAVNARRLAPGKPWSTDRRYCKLSTLSTDSSQSGQASQLIAQGPSGLAIDLLPWMPWKHLHFNDLEAFR